MTNGAGLSVLTSAVPIILFALLLFVLLALAGVILLSLALRYRAGTARRQARRWVASLNVWMTSFSAVFFLSFTLLLSFWVGSAFGFALTGMFFGGIRISYRIRNHRAFCVWLVARHACRQQY